MSWWKISLYQVGIRTQLASQLGTISFHLSCSLAGKCSGYFSWISMQDILASEIPGNLPSWPSGKKISRYNMKEIASFVCSIWPTYVCVWTEVIECSNAVGCRFFSLKMYLSVPPFQNKISCRVKLILSEIEQHNSIKLTRFLDYCTEKRVPDLQRKVLSFSIRTYFL